MDQNRNVYVSYSDAADKLGMKWGTVRDILTGRRGTRTGMSFTYIEV